MKLPVSPWVSLHSAAVPLCVQHAVTHWFIGNQGESIVSPYVRMVREQDTDSNGCISLYMYDDSLARRKCCEPLPIGTQILPTSTTMVAKRQPAKMLVGSPLFSQPG